MRSILLLCSSIQIRPGPRTTRPTLSPTQSKCSRIWILRSRNCSADTFEARLRLRLNKCCWWWCLEFTVKKRWTVAQTHSARCHVLLYSSKLSKKLSESSRQLPIDLAILEISQKNYKIWRSSINWSMVKKIGHLHSYLSTNRCWLFNSTVVISK